MFSPRDQVIVDFSHINQGDTFSGQRCPKCQGGNGKEFSMSVGRSVDGWLWWRCHRASCNFRGSEALRDPKVRGENKQQEKGKLTFQSASLIGTEWISTLCERLNLTDNLIANAKWGWTNDYQGRVIMPIFNQEGQIAGELLRSYDPKADKKALINRRLDGELICWYQFQKYPQVLVIVEDQPSSLRIAGVKGLASVALLGTHLNYERCQEIRRSGITKIVLCLDQDATAQAVQLMVNNRRWLPGLQMIALDKDVKNMSTDEFSRYIDHVQEVTKRGI